ncbi:monocarboxylate transporter 6-like isoform X2 [Penaeus japonicus]|uniref:monocarboxylate transporter 6-like isoform X2 n=1 Tax=Penaeus japonicus TaxID=27405 RepID=UPI001C7134C9|nr:monocarboxylate transporter 6-like isoform X2 [Penaeus japonicus]
MGLGCDARLLHHCGLGQHRRTLLRHLILPLPDGPRHILHQRRLDLQRPLLHALPHAAPPGSSGPRTRLAEGGLLRRTARRLRARRLRLRLLRGLSALLVLALDRKRGIANALMNLGISTGQMAGPILISYLQELYGFSGGTLILSAIVLNCCVGASVLHPVEWHTNNKKRRKKNDRGEHEPILSKEERGVLGATARFFNNVFNNLLLLRSPRVFIIALGSSLNTTGFLNFLMMAPFALQAAGHSLEESSWCMSVFGLCNLVTRLVVSSLTDLPNFSKRGCYMTGTAIAFVSVITFSFTEDLAWSKVVMGLWGCGVGSFMGIHSLIMVEYVGLGKLVPTLGVCGIMNGLCFLLIGPLIGLIRDASRSYAVSMWALSANFAISFTLWMLMPIAVSYDRRREERTQESPT